MKFKTAFKHWLHGTYPTVEEMFEEQFGIGKGGYCIDTGNCRSCYAKLKNPTVGYYGNITCVKCQNVDWAKEINKIL